MVQHITVNCFKNNFHSQNSLVMDGSALKHFKHPDYKNALEGSFRCHMHAFIFLTLAKKMNFIYLITYSDTEYANVVV